MTLDFHPDALGEFQDAAHWYEEQSFGLGDKFTAAVEAATRIIVVDPGRCQPVEPGIRLFRLKRFPYKIYFTYDETEQIICVQAVMHNRQKPEYWRSRIASPPGS